MHLAFFDFGTHALALVLGGIALGFVASFVSALFGGGAGLVLVPGIFWLLVHDYPTQPYLMQTTLATCFFLAIPIGLVASFRQLRFRNIDRTAFLRYSTGIILGAFIGSIVILFIKTHFLKIYFSIMVALVALWLCWRKPEISDAAKRWPKPILILLSMLVGFLSTTVGVAVFAVPFLMKAGLDIRKAIGISTISVFFYSILCSINLAIISTHLHGLPQHNMGLINLPIAIAAVLPTFIGSSIGAKLTHVISQPTLKRLFIAMMILVAVLMTIPHH